ncbi:ABC-type branched-subunit amino acid transport system substrate-binding protein [Variovorax sp. W2I14]
MKRLLLWAASAYLVLTATTASAQTAGVATDHILIGAFGPISGPAAFLGLAGRDGAALAFKEINALGGVNGRKIQMQFEDDAHSPVRALAAVKKLVEQDRVFMLMSVGGSNATAGTIGYVKERGTPMYVSIASAPEVTYPFARNLFRGATTEAARYGEVYAEFLASHYQAKRIVLMTSRDEYSRNEGDATVAKLKAWFSIEPESRLEFNNGDKDFTSQLIAAQRANPDVIAVFGSPAGSRHRAQASTGSRLEAADLRRIGHCRPGRHRRLEGRCRRREGFRAHSDAAGLQTSGYAKVGGGLAP